MAAAAIEKNQLTNIALLLLNVFAPY